MFQTIWIFLKETLSKKLYYWLSAIFITPLAIYNKVLYPLIVPYWPQAPKGDMKMKSAYILFALLVLFVIASLSSYHKLRSARLTELYETMPEAKKDKTFRIFYRLYKEGESLKNAGTEQRQQWDEDIYQNLRHYCGNNFANNYLMHTGRRYGTYSPINDNNYNNAVAEIRRLIDNDFDRFV
jgi:hypothetical protein